MNKQRGRSDQSAELPDDWSGGVARELGRGPSEELGGLLRALSAEGAATELHHEDEYLRLFETVRALEPPADRLLRRDQRKSLRATRLSGRVAAVAAATLVAGVGAAAAYTGSLPDRLQSSAHHYLGAQAPATDSGSPSSQPPAAVTTTPRPSADVTAVPTPKIPSARPSGPVSGLPGVSSPDLAGAKGRCGAWSKGGLAAGSSAYRALVYAAGGTSQIGTYCDSLLAETPKPTHTKKAPKPSPHAKKAAAPKAAKAHGNAKPAPPGQLKKPPL